MVKYYQIENWGHGFITHEDMERAYIGGYPGDIWVTENVQWAERVGAIEKTKEEAQAIVDIALSENSNNSEENELYQIILP